MAARFNKSGILKSEKKPGKRDTVRVIFCAGQVAETVVILQRVCLVVCEAKKISRAERRLTYRIACSLMSQKHTARSQVAIARTRKQSPYLASILAASLSSSVYNHKKNERALSLASIAEPAAPKAAHTHRLTGPTMHQCSGSAKPGLIS